MTTRSLRGVRDTSSEPELDEFTRLAAIACQVPMAMLTLLDDDQERFASKLGVECGEISRQESLSAVVVASNELVHIEDASTSELLNRCALVAGPPHIKLFAGVPISAAGYQVSGMLSVADIVPRNLGTSQVEALRLLAHQVERSPAYQVRLSSRHYSVATDAPVIEDLRESQRILQTLISNLPGVAYRCRNDRTWSVELISESCLQLMGCSASDLINSIVRMVDLVHPDDLPSLKRKISKALRAKTPYQSTYRIRTVTGQIKWVWEQGCGVFSKDGEVVALEGFLTDISEQKRAEEHIRRMAYFDELTGLPNRLSMRDALSAAIAKSSDSHDPLALLHIEVDNFREINETLGYREGDRLLQEVADRFSGAVGEQQMVAHISESSFSMLLPRADASRAMLTARRLLSTLSKPIDLSGLLLNTDCSIGVALFPGHGSDPDALLRRANVARYSAKRGIEKIAMFAGSLDSDNAQRLRLMTELRRAIDSDELFLVFQPKVHMRSGAVSGVEALVRWRHPERGLMSPGQFIAFAESAGLITGLTHWVLNAAVRESYVWHGSGRAVPIAVNLSSHDLRDPTFIDRVMESLETWGGSPDWIQFELTESCIMEDLSAAQIVLDQLRETGFKIFIDDFGTGYSSLSYLRRLPVDYIKIDQSFVMDLDANEESAAIVRSIIELAHNLGLEVVAEGVESRSIMEMLERWGCEEAQGYCISKPVSGRDFQSWSFNH
ncbi:EAL domain-containing protein [Pseudomonas sp. JM0905a]|uniref:putative bifunctional diguanylate cyclase/phosphodiesterase n=1 Tax=Pseudomonas sp. JM0905a TaxID=2772484 RepID=UPI001683156C|nr:EAL domain-containing protein [Pseudomonas sp. JM0905a]MBD2835575.1 EAL domain-containing protein [Pseudomonas sp. JM0905a]